MVNAVMLDTYMNFNHKEARDQIYTSKNVMHFSIFDKNGVPGPESYTY